MNRFSDFLQTNGVKPSVQRLKIYEFMHSNRVHPTVDMVYTALSPSMPTLSKTTVYNTLKLFVSKGIVRTINIEDTETRYDVDMAYHGHFKCRNCGEVFDVALPDLQLNEKLSANYDIDDIQINLKGYCNVCRTIKQ